MKNKTSLKLNYIYSLSYQILTIIAPLITTPYISRVLGAENIGIYSFVSANVVYFVLLGVFGLSTYSQLEVARRRDNPEELSRFCYESIITRFVTMGISIIVYIVMYLILGNQFKLYYTILLLTLIGNMLDFTWVCQGLEDFRTITIRNFAVKILSVVSIFTFIRTGSDLIWYFLINALSILLANIAIIPYISKVVHRTNIEWTSVAKHIKEALIYFLPAMASTIIYSSDKLMIGWLSTGSVQNGLYEQATKIEDMIFMLFGSLYITFRPRMAYLYKHKQYDQIKHYLNKSLSFVLFLSIPVCVGLIQISDIFVPWFFGDGYEGVVSILNIMSVWILIKSFSNCLFEESVIHNRGMRIASKIIWIGAIFNIIVNWILIPKFGANGAAIASLLTEILILIQILYYTKNEFKFYLLKNSFVKDVISALCMFVIVFFLKYNVGADLIGNFVIIISGCITYTFVSFLLKNEVLYEVINMFLEKCHIKRR